MRNRALQVEESPFLFGSLQQCSFDDDKRTPRLMMNGMLKNELR